MSCRKSVDPIHLPDYALQNGGIVQPVYHLDVRNPKPDGCSVFKAAWGETGHRRSLPSAFLALGAVLSFSSSSALASCGDHVVLVPSTPTADVTTAEYPKAPEPAPQPCSGLQCSGRQAPPLTTAPLPDPGLRSPAAIGCRSTLDAPDFPSGIHLCPSDPPSPDPCPEPVFHPPR